MIVWPRHHGQSILDIWRRLQFAAGRVPLGTIPVASVCATLAVNYNRYLNYICL